MSRSITTWLRIEPQSDAIPPGPDAALQARISDPAWMLGRQWQLGELTGDDAGSPVGVRLRAAAAPLTRLQCGGPDGAVQEIEPTDPLEPLVQAEAGQAATWSAALAGGIHFLQALDLAGLDGLIPALRDAFPVVDPDPEGHDPLARRRFRVLRREGIDGNALRAAVRGPDGEPRLPQHPQVQQAEQDTFLDVVRRWLAWHPDPPAGAGTAWVPERFEYRFAVAATDPVGGADVVLEAPEFRGGRLDWPDLRAADAARVLSAATATPAPVPVLHASLPTRATYPGMPANRWWEMEDGDVSYGHIEAEGGDLARLMAIEFATVYGNDWFLAPCDVPYGSVAVITSLVVTDTFGDATLIGPAVHDGWNMFVLSGIRPDILVTLPVLGPTLQGSPVEQVRLARDEAANLAWGIERTVTNVTGDVVDRHEAWRDRITASAMAGMPTPDDAMRYTLANDPPDYWIPLVPTADGHRSIRLQRGEIIHGDGQPFPASGDLLMPGQPLAIFDEEVPRSGLQATRSWQFARTVTGGCWAWIARRARPDRGEAASGLRFDELTAE